MEKKIKNFAHRGFSGKYPENTMLAFQKAVDAGCDGIELDVHLSQDGEVVIVHDELLDRTTNQTGLVSDYTLKELKKINAAAGFLRKRSEPDKKLFCEIPTLKEYFQWAKEKDILTNIELKTGVNPYPGIEEKVLKIIDQYAMRERVIISSFNHYSVLRMKMLAPEMEYGLLEESWIVDAAEYTKKLGIGSMHPICYAVTKEYVAKAKAAGLKIHTWTVNTREQMVDLIEKDVDILIGNYPDLCKEVLEEYRF